MTTQLDSNTSMSTSELLAKGGQTYAPGDDGRLSLVHNPTEPVTMPLDTPILPRACQFQTRTWEGKRCVGGQTLGGRWVISDWMSGILHMWGTDYEEFETGPGLFPVGVIEDVKGTMHSISVDRIRMKKP